MRPPLSTPWPRALFAVLAAAVIPACGGGGGGGNDGGDLHESATITFVAADSSGDESVTPAHVQLSLSAPFSTDPAWVDVAVTGGTADPGTDFTPWATTIIIPPRQTQAAVDLDVTQDGFDEPDETVELTLSNPRCAGTSELTLGGVRVHTYTIKAQNASGSPTLSFRVPVITVDEAAGSATVTVELSRAAAGPVTVDYAVTGGTADPGTDFSLAPGTLTFPAGSLTQSFSIPIADDTLDEDDETIQVTLSNASGAQIGGPATATLTIRDNDPAPAINFQFDPSSGSEATPHVTLVVTLSNPSTRTVTVNYRWGGGLASLGRDFSMAFKGQLSFAPGTTSQTIPVDIIDDTVDEDDEWFSVDLTDPTNGTLGTQATHTYTIVDDDPSPTVQFEQATSSGAENQGTATVWLVLSAVTERVVTVNYAVTGGTATGGGVDYALTRTTLSFQGGRTGPTRFADLPITINDDAIPEPGGETIVFELISPTNAILGPQTTHAFTIIDND